MGATSISWTGTRLPFDLVLSRDVTLDGKVKLLAGKHPTGEMLPGFTHNSWLGCVRKSRACQSCYAEAFVKRVGYTPDGHHHLNIWGPAKTTPRVRTSAANWKRPIKWNKIARDLGIRFKVFAHSLSDVGEDHPMVRPWRQDLFAMIDATPSLDWLLLTKRPETLADEWPEQWRRSQPHNVWAGVTAEDQECADERLPELLKINARVHWSSHEPLVGPLNVERYLKPGTICECPADRRCDREWIRCNAGLRRLRWGIGGGESGAGHETMELPWLVDLHRQYAAAGEAFFTKQDSGPYPGRQGRIPDDIWNTKQHPTVTL